MRIFLLFTTENYPFTNLPSSPFQLRFIDHPVVRIINAPEAEMRVSGSVFRQLQVAWNNGEETNNDNSFWWMLLWSYP